MSSDKSETKPIIEQLTIIIILQVDEDGHEKEADIVLQRRAVAVQYVIEKWSSRSL